MRSPRAQVSTRHGSLYQRLLWLYPASFRREYGEEMVLVFTDRLRAEAGRRRRAASARVWLHTVGDLALSVPKQQLEAFMSRQQTTALQLSAVVAMVVLTIAAASYFAGPFALVPFLGIAAGSSTRSATLSTSDRAPARGSGG
jgi:hypothetical protein